MYPDSNESPPKYHEVMMEGENHAIKNFAYMNSDPKLEQQQQFPASAYAQATTINNDALPLIPNLPTAILVQPVSSRLLLSLISIF